MLKITYLSLPESLERHCQTEQQLRNMYLLTDKAKINILHFQKGKTINAAVLVIPF